MYQIILNNGKMLNRIKKGGETFSWLQEDQNMK